MTSPRSRHFSTVTTFHVSRTPKAPSNTRQAQMAKVQGSGRRKSCFRNFKILATALEFTNGKFIKFIFLRSLRNLIYEVFHLFVSALSIPAAPSLVQHYSRLNGVCLSRDYFKITLHISVAREMTTLIF